MKKLILYVPLFAAVTSLHLLAVYFLLQILYGLYLLLAAVTVLYLVFILLAERFHRRGRSVFVPTGFAVTATLAALTLGASLLPAVRAHIQPWDLWVFTFFILTNAGCLALAAILWRLFEGAARATK